MDKKFIFLGMTIGGMIGGYIPDLWGASMFSFSGVLCGAIGSIIGIWIAFRFTRDM